MKLLLMADGIVGNSITKWLIDNHKKDLAFVVVKEAGGYIARQCTSAKVQCGVLRGDITTILEPKKYDLGMLVWWPDIIPPWLIKIPKRGFINTHPSLLPHNRGKHPNFWAIVEERPFGVSLHEVEEGVDCGRIIAQKKIPFDWTDTGETLYRGAEHEMISLFKKTYPKLRRQNPKGHKNNLSAGSYHRSPEIEAASCIDLDSPTTARELLNRLRARTFYGHPACSFSDKGSTYEVITQIRRRNGR